MLESSNYTNVVDIPVAMIEVASFIDLVRSRLGDLFRDFDFRESGTKVGRAFAELTETGNLTYLTVGIDQRQDYRVYAKIGKTGGDGQPLPGVVRPTKVSDVVEFDLEFVVAQAGQLKDGFGSFGSGGPEEVGAALDDLANALRHCASRLLAGDKREWDRLAEIMVSR